MKIAHIAFHLVCYHVAWFACIISAADGYRWLGLFIVGVILLLQWCWQKKCRETKLLWSLILLLTSIGFIVNTIFIWINIIHFNANPWHMLCPPWMIAIWLNFAMVFYACLQDLFYRYMLLGTLSLLGFPLAYTAGVKLGAANLPYGNWSSLLIGLTWAILLPTTTYTYRTLWLK